MNGARQQQGSTGAGVRKSEKAKKEKRNRAAYERTKKGQKKDKHPARPPTNTHPTPNSSTTSYQHIPMLRYFSQIILWLSFSAVLAGLLLEDRKTASNDELHPYWLTLPGTDRCESPQKNGRMRRFLRGEVNLGNKAVGLDEL